MLRKVHILLLTSLYWLCRYLKLKTTYLVGTVVWLSYIKLTFLYQYLDSKQSFHIYSITFISNSKHKCQFHNRAYSCYFSLSDMFITSAGGRVWFCKTFHIDIKWYWKNYINYIHFWTKKFDAVERQNNCERNFLENQFSRVVWCGVGYGIVGLLTPQRIKYYVHISPNCTQTTFWHIQFFARLELASRDLIRMFSITLSC